MGCFSDREKGPPEETAKWDFITLSDFRCTSGWTVAAYIWLWFMALIGVAVYVLDTYTAVLLLAFNSWSSKVQPKLDFKYSKWIFAVCICLSWALCFYEWLRAIRVIRRGGVAESFLDPLAVDIQSMRRQGWKRFLVFTELTKSKKGADYVALFVYFSFKTAIRVILAQGPRQVVNGLTLYAVMSAELIPNAPTDRSNFDQFWYNVQVLADQDIKQALVLFAMLITLFIWVFSAISLFISGVLYIFFLWHYIPQRDGRLSIYCRRKVDKRLAKIVEHKVLKAIEEEQRKAEKADRKAELQRRKTGEEPPIQASLRKQPTLPMVGGTTPEIVKDDKMSNFPLSRQDTTATVSTLPPYSARPSDPRQPTLPHLDTGGHPGMPTRSGTQSSGWSAAPSYATNASLLGNAGYAGGPEDPPLPPLPSAVTRQESYSSFNGFHDRSDSQSTQGSRRPFTPGPLPGSRSQTPMSARPFTPGVGGMGPGYPRPPPGPRMPTPARSNTAFSFDQEPQSAISAQSHDPYSRPFAPPMRSNTADGYRPQGPAHQASDSSFQGVQSQRSFSRPMPGRPGPPPASRQFSPATSTVLETTRSPTPESFEMQPQHQQHQPSHDAPTTTSPPSTVPPSNSYVAFNPSMQTRTTTPTVQDGPRRNITVTPPAVASDYFGNLDVPQRSTTAPVSMHSNYAHDILDEYKSSDDDSSRRPSPGPWRGH